MCSVYILVCHKFVFNIFALFTDAQNALSGDNSSAGCLLENKLRSNRQKKMRESTSSSSSSWKKKFPSFRHPPNACALQLDSQYITAAKLPYTPCVLSCTLYLSSCIWIWYIDMSFPISEASKCLAYDGMEYMRYDIVRLLRYCYAMYVTGVLHVSHAPMRVCVCEHACVMWFEFIRRYIWTSRSRRRMA